VWQAGAVKGFLDGEPRHRSFDYGEPFNLPNHPAVGVTWYEALAFCRWLTEAWPAAERIDAALVARLPSEAEWEKAARGGVKIPASPIVARAGAVPAPYLKANPHPRRRYPWGDEADPNRANYDDTGIGTTSAVGCFPGGASLYGVEDLSGNVWEWTRSLYKDYPYDPEDGREEPEGEGSRVLRGGAFYDGGWLLRCAFRLGPDPDYRYWNLGFRVVVAPNLTSDL